MLRLGQSARTHFPCQGNGLRRVLPRVWGKTMTGSTIERLTARHRDCLQLVASNHSSKEIAIKLALSPNTVDGYINEAREILGARSRRDAARIFRDFAGEEAPHFFRANFSRVASDNESILILDGAAENHLRDVTGSEYGVTPSQGSAAFQEVSFHWFRGTREHNSLNTGQRLIWIAVASMVAALVFLAALNIIDTLSRLLSH